MDGEREDYLGIGARVGESKFDVDSAQLDQATEQTPATDRRPLQGPSCLAADRLLLEADPGLGQPGANRSGLVEPGSKSQHPAVAQIDLGGGGSCGHIGYEQLADRVTRLVGNGDERQTGIDERRPGHAVEKFDGELAGGVISVELTRCEEAVGELLPNGCRSGADAHRVEDERQVGHQCVVIEVRAPSEPARQGGDRVPGGGDELAGVEHVTGGAVRVDLGDRTAEPQQSVENGDLGFQMLDQQIARKLACQVGPDRRIGEACVEAPAIDVAEVCEDTEQVAGQRDEVGDDLGDIDRTVAPCVEPCDELVALFDEVDDRGRQLEVGQCGCLHGALVAQIAKELAERGRTRHRVGERCEGIHQQAGDRAGGRCRHRRAPSIRGSP